MSDYSCPNVGCLFAISTFRQKWTRLLPCSGIATCLAFRLVPLHSPHTSHAVPVLAFRPRWTPKSGQ
jgi:hypothetical protein